MSNSVLLDTNVLIYAIDADSKFHDQSQKLLLNQSYEFVTTSKNISEFLVALTRAESLKISVDQALDILQDFTEDIPILYPNQKSSMLFYELLRKYNPSGLKIHDFEIAAIALAFNIKCIASFNESDFKHIKELTLILP